MQDGLFATPRRCGSSFAEEVARNVQKGEAPMLLRERLEIRLDENLNLFFAGINLDTNRLVAKVNLVDRSPRTKGVGHYPLALKIGGYVAAWMVVPHDRRGSSKSSMRGMSPNPQPMKSAIF
jgi:hypothetical protein